MKLFNINEAVDVYKRRLEQRGAIVGTVRDFADKINERLDWGIQEFYFQHLDPQDTDSIELLSDTLKGI